MGVESQSHTFVVRSLGGIQVLQQLYVILHLFVVFSNVQVILCHLAEREGVCQHSALIQARLCMLVSNKLPLSFHPSGILERQLLPGCEEVPLLASARFTGPEDSNT